MSMQQALGQMDILGTRVTSGTQGNVIAHIIDRIERKIPTRVAFFNAHLANICARESSLRSHLADFVVLNDGIGVEIAARVLHRRAFEDNLNGTDLTPSLLDASKGLRIFLLGARYDVVAAAGAAIEKRWPRHRIVGIADGFFGPADSAGIAQRIAEAGADLVLVGMGNPRQERWIAENIPHTCPCAIAIGAWFDFLTQQVPRAPLWVRRAKFEWLFRLCIEPRRLARRYLVGNPAFLARVAVARFRLARGRHAISGAAE